MRASFRGQRRRERGSHTGRLPACDWDDGGRRAECIGGHAVQKDDTPFGRVSGAAAGEIGHLFARRHPHAMSSEACFLVGGLLRPTDGGSGGGDGSRHGRRHVGVTSDLAQQHEPCSSLCCDASWRESAGLSGPHSALEAFIGILICRRDKQQGVVSTRAHARVPIWLRVRVALS